MSAKFENDQLRIIIKPNNTDDFLISLKKIISILSDSFLPNPTKIILTDGTKYAINGFLDSLVISSLENSTKDAENTFQLINKDRENVHIISTSGSIYSVIHSKFLPDGASTLLKTLVHSIIKQTQPAYVNCSFDKVSRKIYFKHFEWEDRSLFSPNLEWLQYFGSKEYKLQGGKEILANPYIEAEPLDNGVLIQVGESPHDAFTPEGEALLVKATKAMPPVAIDNVD